MDIKPKVVKCRGIIINDDKILLAKHSHNSRDFYAFLGGHLEENESLIDCTERELTEELGVVPEVGKLLYVNQYSEENNDYIEFFFEIKNGKDFLKIDKSNSTHGYELVDVLWVSKDDNIKVLPERIFNDFKDKLAPDTVVFIKDK